MLIYNYDNITGEFLSSSEARANPKEEGEYLIPANDTIIPPLEIKNVFVVCFINDVWKYQTDNRLKPVFSTEDKLESVVDYIGEIKEGFTLDVPIIGDFVSFVDGAWINDMTEQAEYDSKQYARDRAEAYPSLTEQADMAYWDRQNGTTTLDDAISAVKLQFPKETI